LQLLKGISGQYAGLFNSGIGESEADGGETFSQRWGWIVTLNNLSNNDRSKWDYYGEMNVIEFLNTVVFYKEKSEYELAQWQAAQRK
jgi:hypothetical protein